MAAKSEHSTTLCNACGQSDDHPKIHVWGNWAKDPDAQEVVVVRDPSFHFDCLPEEFTSRLEGNPSHARSMATREAALSGVRGQKLRDHIQSLPDDNALEE